MQRKMMMIGVVACVLALVAGLSFAQAGGGAGQGGGGGRRQQGGGPGGGPGGGRGNFDPAQMRQMMADRMKQQLGVGDAEWKVMEPRLMKVMDLSRQASGGGRGGMMGMMGGMRGRGPGGPGGNNAGPQGGPQGPQPPQPQGELTAVDKTLAALNTVLQNESASPEEIKKAVTAVRQAREKAKQDLAVAEQQLKEILSVRQEGQLVAMSVIP